MNRVIFIVFSFLICVGCANLFPADEPSSDQIESTEESALESSEDSLPTGKPHIVFISRDINDPFWVAAAAGASEAAEKLGADFLADGPAPELSDIEQADILSRVINDAPSAICLAPISGESVSSQLKLARDEEIVIVGLNSGDESVLEAVAEGTAYADNYAAGGLAAQSMLGRPFINEKIRNASAAEPVSIAIVAQYEETEAVNKRIQGFIDTASSIAEGLNSKGVEIMGRFEYERKNDGAAVNIVIITPEGSSAKDNEQAALLALNSGGLIGCLGVNQSASEGILAASSDGIELDRTSGKYKDLAVVGFDAGAEQKEAVKKQYFLGSVVLDSYMMGHISVELAYDALQGDTISEMTDAGSRFYSSDNMNNSEIARLLYD